MDFVNEFLAISNGSKYARWYAALIDNAQKRECKPNGEKHHIIPRSFKTPGVNTKENIVNLTEREHFVAHKLLWYSMSDSAFKKKAVFAFFMMSGRMKQYSKNAGKLRNDVKATVSAMWKDENFRDRVISGVKKAWKDPEYLRKSREGMRSLWKTESYRAIQAERAKTKYASAEYRKKRSENTIKQMSDPEQRAIAVKTLAEAHSKIDHSSKEWVTQSFGSEKARASAKKSHQSDSFRAMSRDREMSKPESRRVQLAKTGAAALRAKFSSDEEFSIYLSNRVKGRTKIVDMSTGAKRMVNPECVPDGWVVYKTLSADMKQQIASMACA